MFSTPEVCEEYGKYKPTILDVLEHLNNGISLDAEQLLSSIRQKVSDCKDEISVTSDKILNEFFVLNSYIDLLLEYSRTWFLIREGQFGNSWQSLQSTMDLLRTVKKFSKKNNDSEHLAFFENQLVNLEKLYPYNVFFSVGAVVDYYECSICGADIDSILCPHIKGGLYGGVMAVAIAKNMNELNHVSMVKYPADKRCVVQYDDTGEQFKLVRYLADLLNKKRLKPFDFGELRFSTRMIENPDYKKLGRNEVCFCGSGKKFKHCCIDKKIVEEGHVDIISNPIAVRSVMA